MALWWVGNALLAFVVTPLVVFLANRLIRTTLEIRRYADDVLEHGVGITGALDAVPKLVRTLELTAAARDLVGQYGAALAQLQALSAGAPSVPARRETKREGVRRA